MDSDTLASMYAQIVRGVPKAESQNVTDDESAALWDKISGEVEQMRSDGVAFDVPAEIPNPPDPSTTTPTDPAEPAPEQPDDPAPEGDPE